MKTKADKAAYQKDWRNRQSPEKQEEIRTWIRDWYSRNRDRQIKIRRDRYYLNIERERATILRTGRLWRLDPSNRDKMKSYRKAAKARRRSSISSSGKTITHSEWMGMIQLFENKCAYCHEIMEVPTQDHVIPLSKGGTHTYDNIMQACMSCNQRKKDRSLDDFLADPNRKMPKRK